MFSVFALRSLYALDYAFRLPCIDSASRQTTGALWKYWTFDIFRPPICGLFLRKKAASGMVCSIGTIEVLRT